MDLEISGGKLFIIIVSDKRPSPNSIVGEVFCAFFWKPIKLGL